MFLIKKRILGSINIYWEKKGRKGRKTDREKERKKKRKAGKVAGLRKVCP